MKKLPAILFQILFMLSCTFKSDIKEGGDCKKGDFQIIETIGHGSILALDRLNRSVHLRYYEQQNVDYTFLEDLKNLSWPQGIPYPTSVGDSFEIVINQYGHWYGSCGFEIDSSTISLVSEKLSKQ